MGQRETSSGSLFAAIAEGVASQEQSARLQKLEIALGFLGFFTLMALISTVAATLSGRPAVVEALIAAGFVALTVPVLRRWRSLGASIARGRRPARPSARTVRPRHRRTTRS